MSSFMQKLGTAFALLLVIPVPVFALINFSGVTWTTDTVPTGQLFTFVPVPTGTGIPWDNSDHTSTLNFTVPDTVFATGTTTITSSLIDPNGTDTLRASWSGLTFLNNSNTAIGVTITVLPANVMFSQSFGGGAGGDPSAITNIPVSAPFRIEVKFTPNNSFIGQPSSFFTLTFTH